MTDLALPEPRTSRVVRWCPGSSDRLSLDPALYGCVANHRELAESLDLPPTAPLEHLLDIVVRRLGPAAAARIHGPVAWIHADGARGRLLAASDRVGLERVYYRATGDEIWLSLDLEALLDALPARPEPNPRAVVAHLDMRPPPRGETPYEGISVLAPGELLVADASGWRIETYWRLRRRPPLRLASDEEYAEALRQLLAEVFAEYAPPSRAGITLSGGLDSTAVAATLRRLAPRAELAALSWTSPELPEADEGEAIREVASRLGLGFHPLRADRLWSLCHDDGVRTRRASPYFNYYTEAWEATFAAARELGATTLYSGAGGDQLAGGGLYAYADLLLTGRWVELARHLRQHRRERPMSLPRLLRRLLLSPLADAYLPAWRARRRPLRPWLGPRSRPIARRLRREADRPVAMLPARVRRLRFAEAPVMPRVLRHSAALGRAAGVELRHPLLDHRVLEFAVRLPPDQTARRRREKIVVRNAFRGVLPDRVIDQVDKVLPSAIAHRGLREREREKVWRLMRGMRAAELGYVDEERLREEYRGYLAGEHQRTAFWCSITLEDWLRRHF